ncbi:MAG TPA: LytR C-terminal domain-containing protein [Sphingomicrobium sp.]|nr:LytR C-terminal domain-containing protein [Sphingomicrobium sp.]
MDGGTKFLACSAMLLVAACGGEGGKLEIRAMPTPLTAGKKPVSFRVAEGHQQMAMNNVALALESYRRALRDDPDSVDAHAGIAAGYDRMGRYDLARRSYEAALAIEPGNTTVLAMLAASLDQQGKAAAAAAIRGEIRQRLAAAASPVTSPSAESAPSAPPAHARAAAIPPAPAAPAVVATAETPLPAPDLSPVLSTLASTPLAVSNGTIAPAAVVAAFAPDEPEAAAERTPAPARPLAVAEASPPARSVTIKLPPPRPAAAPKIETAAAGPALRNARAMAAIADAPAAPELPARQPAKPQPAVPASTAPVALAASGHSSRPAAALPVATGPGPRLERTSLGEVALRTTRQPQWASLVVQTSQRSATVRFVPIKQAGARFASVRLLNAARVNGLAARTRSTLLDRGWRSMAIGNAGAVRARSLVLYPAHRRTIALSLARQFGFAAARTTNGNQITVLLGRDAVTMVRRAPAG